MKPLVCKMFGGEKSIQYNVLMSALIDCAGGTQEIYEYLEQTPKTSLIVELVDMINLLGYEITPASQDKELKD